MIARQLRDILARAEPIRIENFVIETIIEEIVTNQLQYVITVFFLTNVNKYFFY